MAWQKMNLIKLAILKCNVEDYFFVAGYYVRNEFFIQYIKQLQVENKVL